MERWIDTILDADWEEAVFTCESKDDFTKSYE
jgi:hypothetical protein